MHANKYGIVKDSDGKVKFDTRAQFNDCCKLPHDVELLIDGEECCLCEYVKKQDALSNVRILEEEQHSDS